jgi:hypothetical protein
MHNAKKTEEIMTSKKIFLSLTILQSFILTSFGQTVVIPKEFVETIPPKVMSADWYPLNYSKNEFGVKIIDHKLKIKNVKEINNCELKIASGTLLGIDNGEWGGQLTFKPEDTSKKSIEIKGGNIKFIFNFRGKTYFIEGLAHMGYNGGAIFELETTNNKFTFTKLVDFDDAPMAFAIYKDKFLIATFENFYIVEDFKKELVFEKTFWRGLAPNSIAVLDDKNVFIGITSGIIKLDLTEKILKFYKNDK